MLDQKNLIFLISLPRSGSTLLQKLLLSHSQIASVAEPWLIFPFVMAFKNNGILTEYGHRTFLRAHRLLFSELPNGAEDYISAVRHCALTLYGKLTGGKPYFLDKTPPYFFILPQLYQLFPDARYIFLFRNPLGVFASALHTFRSNRLKRIDHLDRILYEGPRLMAEGYHLIRGRAIVVTYERIIDGVDREIARILQFLGLSPETGMVSRSFKHALNGLGDNQGARRFTAIQDQSDNWKRVIDTPCRSYCLKNFLRRVDEVYLDLGGYNRADLLSGARDITFRNWRFQELFWLLEASIVRALKHTVRGLRV